MLCPRRRARTAGLNLEKSVAIFQPSDNTWAAAGSKHNAASDEESWVLLPDESVLSIDCDGHPATERYVPNQNGWVSAGDTPVDLVEAASKEVGPAILLPTGDVLAIGATGATALYTPPTNPADPGAWRAGPAFPKPPGVTDDIGAKDAPACLLPNGKVLCTAGPVDGTSGDYLSPTYFYEYEASSAKLTLVPSPSNASEAPFNGRFLLVPNGQALYSNGSRIVSVYTPDGAADPTWAPTIQTSPPEVKPGQTFQISGIRFTGLSQAVAYGDDAAMATNYPIVRLVSDIGTSVVYCRTHDHSSMGVAVSASTLITTNFDVPDDCPLGRFKVEVVANGIASAPVPLEVVKPPVVCSMADPPRKVDVPTGSMAQLNPPAVAQAPLSWTKNGTAWKAPAPPVQVDPTIGKDDVYRVVDATGATFGGIVRWQPGPAVKPQLKPGRGSAKITWGAVGSEGSISYYQVNLDPQPSTAHLPRKVKRAAGTGRTNRFLALEGLPPDIYTAQVRTVREGDYGPVTSEGATTDSGEVVPTSGSYPGWVRILLGVLFLASAAGAIVLLLHDPRRGHTIDLNGWALGTAALVTFALVAVLCVIVRVGDLMAGADNRISTSRVNVALWTVAIAFGILTLAAFAFGAFKYHLVNPCGLHKSRVGFSTDGICVNGHAVATSQLGLAHTFRNGLAPNYLVLLGAPFAALAGSAFIVNRQVSNGSRQKVQSAGPKRFTRALTNDDGSADLVDSQYLIFTGVLFFYFLTSFIPNPSVLPDLPWSLVGLTGVSAGTYLLNKSVTTNGLSIQGLASNSVKQGGSARVLGNNFLPEGSKGLVNGGLSVSLDGTTPTITKVSDTEVTFTVNVPTGTYNVELTTAANVSGSAGSLQVT